MIEPERSVNQLKSTNTISDQYLGTYIPFYITPAIHFPTIYIISKNYLIF